MCFGVRSVVVLDGRWWKLVEVGGSRWKVVGKWWELDGFWVEIGDLSGF